MATLVMNRDARVSIMAAVFAITNMGAPLPPKGEILSLIRLNEKRLKEQKPFLSPASNVSGLCQQLCESDEHLEGFEDEARTWFEELSDYSDAEIARIWPDVPREYPSLFVLDAAAKKVSAKAYAKMFRKRTATLRKRG